MIFNYEKKLQVYKTGMDYLNMYPYETNKIRNLLKYARENGIINNKNCYLGELEAIYNFYLLDLQRLINKIEQSKPEDKYQFQDRIDADIMIIESLSENNEIKSIYRRIYEILTKVEKLEKVIKEEDKVSFKTNNKKL